MTLDLQRVAIKDISNVFDDVWSIEGPEEHLDEIMRLAKAAQRYEAALWEIANMVQPDGATTGEGHSRCMERARNELYVSSTQGDE